jgi:hypothetical protein
MGDWDCECRFLLAIVRSTWIEIRNISALLCYDIHMSKCVDILTVVPAQLRHVSCSCVKLFFSNENGHELLSYLM